MNYTYHSRDEVSSPVWDRIWDWLCIAKDEFIPPLNRRSGTMDLLSPASELMPEAGPVAYFSQLRDQSLLLASADQSPVGFMSIREESPVDRIPGCPTGHYISTIIVDPQHRGKGVCRGMYEELFRLRSAGRLSNAPFITRTWSTNASHIPLLNQLNFSCVYKLADDRGPHIDTWYFLKS